MEESNGEEVEDPQETGEDLQEETQEEIQAEEAQEAQEAHFQGDS